MLMFVSQHNCIYFYCSQPLNCGFYLNPLPWYIYWLKKIYVKYCILWYVFVGRALPPQQTAESRDFLFPYNLAVNLHWSGFSIGLKPIYRTWFKELEPHTWQALPLGWWAEHSARIWVFDRPTWSVGCLCFGLSSLPLSIWPKTPPPSKAAGSAWHLALASPKKPIEVN